MAKKATSFLTNRNAVIGTSLGSPSGGQYPQTTSYMYWPPAATGNNWPSSDLANYNRHKELWGPTKPGVVTFYVTDITANTGTSGSAGTYGMITPDHRSIANDGCILWYSFKYGTAANWQATANLLNGTGDNAAKQAARVLETNLRRWALDTGNTASVKKVLLNGWHEPANDGSTAAAYVAWFRAFVTYLARRGIGDNASLVPLDTASDPGGAATWVGLAEWTFTDIGDTWFSNGDDNPYFPGDDYVTWACADAYNWGGAQSPSTAADGGISQPGDSCLSPGGSNNYAKAWKPYGAINGIKSFLTWATTKHPTLRLGIREFSTGEYVNRWPTTGTTIASGTKLATSKPLLKGGWFQECARFFRGDGPSANADPLNAGWTNPNQWGQQLQMIAFWNSQAAAPRWLNTIPYNVADTTGAPSTTGTVKTASFDGFVQMVNDPWFAVSQTNTPPSLGAIAKTGTNLAAVFDVTTTPGSGTITGYAWDYGDGTTGSTGSGNTSHTTRTYASGGTYTAQVKVTDSNGLTATASVTFTVAAASTPPSLGSIGTVVDSTGLNLTFSAAGTAGGATTLTQYDWSFGDGTIGNTTGVATSSISHAYALSGTYTVTCTVTQSDGLQNTVTASVTVTEVVTQVDGFAPWSGAPLWLQGDRWSKMRTKTNAAFLALDSFIKSRERTIPLDFAGGNWAVPAALTVFRGDSWRRYIQNLGGFTSAYLQVVESTSPIGGVKLGLAYSIDNGSTWKWIDGTGATGATVSTTLPAGACQVALSTTGPIVGSVVNLPDDAKQTVQLRLYGIGGDGASNFFINQVVVNLR